MKVCTMIINSLRLLCYSFIFWVFLQSSGYAQTVILDNLKSFPSAEGYGQFAGAGQPDRTVIYVTNLNDSGPGSLRAALTSGSNLLIVFKVAGTITLSSEIVASGDNIYLAGQTAFYNGGQGITLRSNGNYNRGLMVFTGDHVIVRYIRFRRGSDNIPNGTPVGDNLNIFDASDWIVDHCSLSWSTDENINGINTLRGTMQYSISSEGLYFANHWYSANPTDGQYQTGHSMGSLFNADASLNGQLSFYRNLFAHNDQRNPRIAGVGITNELVNNLMYNNRYFNISLDAKPAQQIPMQSNVIKNLQIPGADTRLVRRLVNTNNSIYDQIYMKGNIGVHRTDDTMDEWLEVGTNSNPTPQTGRSFTPFATPMLPQCDTLPDAIGLESIVLSDVGANLNPDDVDIRVINDVINRTPTTAKTVQGTDPNNWNGTTTYYGIINAPSEVGGWPTLDPMNSMVPDANNDGIDDTWASTHGVSSWDDVLPVYTFSGIVVVNDAGYTAREIYLAWLAMDFDRLPQQSLLPMELIDFAAEKDKHTCVLKWRTATETNSDYFDIQRSKDAIKWESIGKVSAAGESLTECSYRFTDTTPFSGNNYYRLRQIDLDGTVDYSRIEVVEFEDRITDEILVYPNPIAASFYLEYPHSKYDILRIELYDIHGRKMLSQQTNTTQNRWEINADELSDGIYFIHLITSTETITKKVIK